MLNALKRVTTPTPTPSPLWPLEVVALPGTVGIRLRGEIDMATLPTLELALDVLIGCACDATVDLTELAFIDVMGFRTLADGAIRLREGGHRLWLRGAAPEFRRLLVLLGWTALFAFEPPAGRCSPAGAPADPDDRQRRGMVPPGEIGAVPDRYGGSSTLRR